MCLYGISISFYNFQTTATWYPKVFYYTTEVIFVIESIFMSMLVMFGYVGVRIADENSIT